MPEWSLIVIAVAALMVDQWLGEPARWHPLVGFGNLAKRVEGWLNASPHRSQAETSVFQIRCRGVLAWSLVVLPFAAAAYWFSLQKWSWLAEVVILYWAIGRQSLRQHARQISTALKRDDLGLARQRMSMIVSRETASMDSTQIASATVESVLENGNDAIFGALFWFLVAGAPAVVLYRLANTLDAMWGYRTQRFLHFGWAAARIDDVLNWFPARLTALSYCLAGNWRAGFAAWRAQARHWDSPNAGPVMASGAGSLQLGLGGPACYDGEWHHRPCLGHGRAAEGADIERALSLLDRALLIWLGVLLFIVGAAHGY